MPKPNVNVDIVPGCNILRNQFAVANYSGPLPCTLPGQAAPAPSAAAGDRRLMQAAFQNTNTSVPCEVIIPVISSPHCLLCSAALPSGDECPLLYNNLMLEHLPPRHLMGKINRLDSAMQ